MAAPVIASSSSNKTGTSLAEPTVTFASDGPSGIAVGDLLIAVVSVAYFDSLIPDIDTAAGWTLWGTATGLTGTSSCRLGVYYRVAQSGDTSVQFTSPLNSSNGGMSLKVVRITGHHASSYANVIATTNDAAGGGFGEAIAPSATTTGDECLVFCCIGRGHSDGISYTTPAGLTEQWDFIASASQDSTQVAGTKTQTTAGATGTYTFVGSSDLGARAAITFAVAPAVVTPPEEEPAEPTVTFPFLIVEAGFTAGATTGTVLHLDDAARGKLDTNTLADDDLFTDITAYTRNVSTLRGSNRVEGPIVRYEAGTLTATLRNTDRRFDPTNLSGPYVSAGATQVEPMRVIRVRASWDGVLYDLWRGYADNWDISYTKARNYSEVVLTATDGFKVLANHVRAAVSAVGAGEDSGARVGRILDSTDWETADRVIATGDTSCVATTLSGDALTELFLVSDTEMGEFYIDGKGRAVFRNRHATLEETRSTTTQATFGDNAGELPYFDVAVTYDEAQLVNEARIAREGGTQQTASDATSKIRYLTQSYERTDLQMETNAVAADYAAFIVFQYKDPELRFAQLVIKPKRDPSVLFPQVLGREIGDRITVNLRPEQGDAISRDCFIRGISHEIDASARTWVTTWTLQSATKYAFFILDHATLGELDSSALAY